MSGYVELMTWPKKDEDERLDYGIDWTDKLIDTDQGINDTISTSTWEVPSGITSFQETNDNYNTVIWLEGGTTGETYFITNHVVTTDGRIMEQTVRITIKDK
jgi:hypothetical protein